MLATARSVTLIGAEARLVDLELVIHSSGLPAFSIGGLATRSVREAEQRTRAACDAIECPWPQRRIVANLAPARLRKDGTHFDLALALAMMAAERRIPAHSLDGWVAMGELGLDGTLRPVPGVLPAAMACRQAGLKGLICPEANGAEAAIVGGIEVAAVPRLELCRDLFRGMWEAPAPLPIRPQAVSGSDLSEVKGHASAKRAAEIAAAGGHNLILGGPPGSGKTMLARRLPSIQPALTRSEALEITRVHSVAGLLDENAGLVAARPFRSPHHNISVAGLIGGGTGIARPGEIALAHRGTLFLDELPLFPRHILECLRGPVEDGVVRIARSEGIVRYDTRFALVGAMNPCPCGYAGDTRRVCECTPLARINYLRKLSGPLLDRFDIFVSMTRPSRSELLDEAPQESSRAVQARVARARARQSARYEGPDTNASVARSRLRSTVDLTSSALKLLSDALDAGMLTARGLDRVIGVSRTIADLDDEVRTGEGHVAEALSLRQAHTAVGVAP